MLCRAGMAALVGAALLAVFAPAQSPTELEKNKGVGDSPDTALPLATDLRQCGVRGVANSFVFLQLSGALGGREHRQ